MASKQVITRVSALSLVGGALLIFVSEAGLSGRDAARPADAADRHIADAFAATQGLALPAEAGFRAAPAIPAEANGTMGEDRGSSARPAAFAPPRPLGVPDTPRPEINPDPAEDRAHSRFGLPCGLDVTGSPSAHATIALDIAAPCHPDAQVSIAVGDLTLGGETDALGLLTLDIPALESPTAVTVRLADGTEAAHRVALPDLPRYDRVALAWTGDLGLELHAMEAGAGWHQPGHVHPGAPGRPEALDDGAGYLVELGTPSGMVQVYTRPLQGIAAGDDVAISVDAPVTAGNCARAAEATVLRREGAGPLEVTPLGFTYPGCAAAGDTLVFHHALRDLRFAAN